MLLNVNEMNNEELENFAKGLIRAECVGSETAYAKAIYTTLKALGVDIHQTRKIFDVLQKEMNVK